jgi:hypothetical protein
MAVGSSTNLIPFVSRRYTPDLTSGAMTGVSLGTTVAANTTSLTPDSELLEEGWQTLTVEGKEWCYKPGAGQMLPGVEIMATRWPAAFTANFGNPSARGGSLGGTQAANAAYELGRMLMPLENAANRAATVAGIAASFAPIGGLALTTTRLGRITFQTAHAARHLAGTGLTASVVEAAIAEEIGLGAVGSHWGWLQVAGQWIQYRAYLLASGTINVGTYFIVNGPFGR